MLSARGGVGVRFTVRVFSVWEHGVRTVHVFRVWEHAVRTVHKFSVWVHGIETVSYTHLTLPTNHRV